MRCELALALLLSPLALAWDTYEVGGRIHWNPNGSFGPKESQKCLGVRFENQHVGGAVTLEPCWSSAVGVVLFKVRIGCSYVRTKVKLAASDQDLCIRPALNPYLDNGSPLVLTACPTEDPWGACGTADASSTDWMSIDDQYWLDPGDQPVQQCMDLKDGNTKNGSPLQIWQCHPKGHKDYKNQKFSWSQKN